MKTFEQFMEHHKKDADGKVLEHGDGTPSSVEEENALEKRAKENEKARKWLKKDAKDSGYTDIALKASMSKGAGVSEDYYRGTGEKVVARTKKFMDKKGQKGAPGLDAMKARTAEHKAKRGVKEEVVTERLGGKGYKPYTSLTGKKVSGDWEDSDRGAGNKAKKRAGGKVEKKSPTYRAHVLNKEEVVTELNRYGKETGKATGSLNKRAGTPVKTGGTSSPVMRAVRTSIRRETGKPEGQQKKERGKKPPVAGEYGARRSPAQIIAKRRQQKSDADAAMRDTRGT